jgi:hypothetical protein
VRLRWVLALVGVALLFGGLTVAAGLRYLIPIIDPPVFDYNDTAQQDALTAYQEWVSSGYPYFELLPWLATAALLAAVGALTLAAYRARGRQVAGTRTVSDPASTSARNPTTIPNSSPSSSNSSARPSFTSNTDAFR